jgi:hypothetical protein
MKAGLDYVFVSYYEVDNANIRPSPEQWDALFQSLQTVFPNAKLGFGEIGMDNPVTSSDFAQAQGIMRYYYGLRPNVRHWAGGDFWWYFAEDCVPTTQPLLATLESLTNP